MCTKNHNHIKYGSGDTEWDRQIFFVILDHFCPFTTLWTQIIKFLKKWKKHLKTLSFYKCVPYTRVIWCIVPEIWSATDRIFFSFWNIFFPFTTNKTKNLNFEKIKKNPGDIIILHMSTINDNLMMYVSWDMLQHDEQNFLTL